MVFLGIPVLFTWKAYLTRKRIMNFFSFLFSFFFDKYVVTGGRIISKRIVEAGLLKMEVSSKKKI